MKYLPAALLALSILAFPACPPSYAEPGPGSHETVCECVTPAIVAINATTKPRDGRGAMSWFGTGTVISEDGAILTSTTVVPMDVDPDRILVLLPGGKQVKATFVGGSEKLEISMIRLPKGRYPFVPLGDSKKLKLGHAVYTFGNCLHSLETDDQVCVASGEVSGFYKITDTFEGKPYYEWCTYKGEVIETSAPLNPGVDGGPLINARGQLVGIMSLSYSESRYLGVAIPLHVLRDQIDRWLRGEVSKPEPPKPPPDPDVEPGDDAEEPGYLGASLAADEPVIQTIAKNSPAAKAGLLAGDRILKVNEKEMRTPAAVVKMVRTHGPGDELTIVVERDGKTKTFKVKLGYGPM